MVRKNEIESLNQRRKGGVLSAVLSFLGFIALLVLLVILAPYEDTMAEARITSRLIWLIIAAYILGWTWRISKIIELLTRIEENVNKIRWQYEVQKDPAGTGELVKTSIPREEQLMRAFGHQAGPHEEQKA
jgi:hypothetical protein